MTKLLPPLQFASRDDLANQANNKIIINDKKKRSNSLYFQHFRLCWKFHMVSLERKSPCRRPVWSRGSTTPAVLLPSDASCVGRQRCETRPCRHIAGPESVSQRSTWAGPRHCWSHRRRPPNQGRMLHGEHRSQWKTPLQHPIAVALWLSGNPLWWKNKVLWAFPNLLPLRPATRFLSAAFVISSKKFGLWRSSGFWWYCSVSVTVDFHYLVCCKKKMYLAIYSPNIENFKSTFKKVAITEGSI